MSKARSIRASWNRRKADGALVIEVLGIEPISGNRWQRLHWAARKKYEEKLLLVLRTMRPKPAKLTQPVVVSYARSYYAHPLDQDNLVTGFKPILDALVDLELLEDDSPSYVTIGQTFQEARGKSPPRFAVILAPRVLASVP